MALQDLPKRGPGRPKGSQNKATVAAKAFLTKLVEDPKVQAAVRRKVLKGETVGFFRAIDKIVPDPPKELTLRGEFKMIQWPDDEDVSET